MPKTYQELKKINGNKKNNIYNHLTSLSKEKLEELLNQIGFFNSEDELIELMKLMKNNQKVFIELLSVLDNIIYQHLNANDNPDLKTLEKIIQLIKKIQNKGIELESNKILTIIQKFINPYLTEVFSQPKQEEMTSNDEQIVKILNIIFNEDILTQETIEKLFEYLIKNNKGYLIEKLIERSISEIKEEEYTEEETLTNYNKSKKFMYLIFIYSELSSRINYEKNNLDSIDIPSKILENAHYPEQFILCIQKMVNLLEPLSIKIFQNRTYIQYLTPESIITFFQNKLNNDFETFKSILFDDKINSNLVDLFNSDILLKIFPFNHFIKTNSETIELLIDFLKRYFTYEKAIFFISLLELDDETKKHIIQKLYNKNNIASIELEKKEIIKSAIDDMLSLKSPVPEYFKKILPELFTIDLDDETYTKLTQMYLSIKDNEYIKLFLMQYFRHNTKKHNIEGYNLYFIPLIAYKFATQKDNTILFTMAENNFDDPHVKNTEYFITIDHELRHVYQTNEKHKISLNALMLVLSAELSSTNEEYQKNYPYLYREIDARTHSIFNTFNFVSKIDPRFGRDFIRNNQHYSGDISDFNADRKTAKSPEYFCNLLTTFFKEIEKEEIIELRNEYRVLALILDENGRLYTPEEIEHKIREIKIESTPTVDLQSNQENVAIYTFLVSYLRLLRYGIDKKIIGIYEENSQTQHKR